MLKKKVYLLFILLIFIVGLSCLFATNPQYVRGYDLIVYYPLQSLRHILFAYIPFSVGDVLYVAAGIWLLLTLIKWCKYVVGFSTYKTRLVASLLNTLCGALGVYLFFIIGWGANYNKLPLRSSWQLNADKDTLNLVQFDSVLVKRLNNLAPHYQSMSFSDINTSSIANYRSYTDSKVSRLGLNVKPTVFAWFMNRIAIEGYYNPFTGEGQVVKDLPAYLLPFVVSHEMAHQAGIAAEGDANLLAYALCTMSDNPTFQYSADLNLWLYVNMRLFRKDSIMAQTFEAQLNELTKAHIDTIEQLNKISDNDARKYSNEMYDSYLKMQQQKEGIRSYGNVTTNAWLLEKSRQRYPQRWQKIKVP